MDVEIAMQACYPTAVSSLVDDIAKYKNTLPHEDETMRLALLAKANGLIRALETPRETMIRHLWGEVCSSTNITGCDD